MKSKWLFIIFIGFVLASCSSAKLFKEYKLYNRDNYFNYPKEKLIIKFTNDTTGLFVNSDGGRKTFTQKFIFSKIKNDFLVIGKVEPINDSLISFEPGDTIVIDKRRLHFFYDGNKKYLLSFKRQ